MRRTQWFWGILLCGFGLGGVLAGLGQSSAHEAGRFPHSVTLGDFNMDGHLDLAVAASAERKVTVLLGDGKGGVMSNHSYAVGRGPVWVTAGDLDGDGHLDLVSTNSGAGSATLY